MDETSLLAVWQRVVAAVKVADEHALIVPQNSAQEIRFPAFRQSEYSTLAIGDDPNVLLGSQNADLRFIHMDGWAFEDLNQK